MLISISSAIKIHPHPAILPGKMCILEGVCDGDKGRGRGRCHRFRSHTTLLRIIRGRGGERLPSEGVKNGFGSELFSAKFELKVTTDELRRSPTT